MAVKKKVKKKKHSYDTKSLKGVKVTLPKGILSFPKLDKAVAYKEGAKPAYSCNIIFDEKTELKPIRQAIFRAKKECFGDDKTTWPELETDTLKDGEVMDEYDGYEGRQFVTPRTYAKPLVLDKDKSKMANIGEDMYPGALVVASVVFKVTESAGKYYVSCYLQGIMKVADGEKLGGGGSVSDFDEVEVEEDSEGAFDDEDDSEDDDDFDDEDDSDDDEDEDEED